MEAVYNEIGDIKCLDYFLESYFKRNKDYAKLIHLSDAQGSGYDSGRHGVSLIYITNMITHAQLH